MMKVAIHSVPRSGSSWLGEIINSSERVNYSFQPLFSYAFKSALNENSSLAEINGFYKNILQSKDDFITQKLAREAGIKPMFVKKDITHIAYKEVRYHYVLENLLQKDPDQKVIGLVRNPLSVLSSWKKAPREFRGDLGWSFNKEWYNAEQKNENRKEEYFGYNKWKEVALLYSKLLTEFPDNFLLVNYDHLLSNINAEVTRIFNFLKLDITEQTKQFINTAGTTEVTGTYSVFRSKNCVDNAWVKNIPEDIVKKIRLDCEKNDLTEFIKRQQKY